MEGKLLMVSLYSFDNFLSSQYTVATIDMSLQVYGGVPIKVAFDSGNSTFSSCLCTSLGVSPSCKCIFCLLPFLVAAFRALKAAVLGCFWVQMLRLERLTA